MLGFQEHVAVIVAEVIVGTFLQVEMTLPFSKKVTFPDVDRVAVNVAVVRNVADAGTESAPEYAANDKIIKPLPPFPPTAQPAALPPPPDPVPLTPCAPLPLPPMEFAPLPWMYPDQLPDPPPPE